MGMSIDNSIHLLEDYLEWQKLHKMDGTGIDEATRNLIDAARKYQIMQAEYETRLRADMVAMLEELKEQLREMHEDSFETEHYDEAYGISVSMDEIQQKINALKGDQAAG